MTARDLRYMTNCSALSTELPLPDTRGRAPRARRPNADSLTVDVLICLSGDWHDACTPTRLALRTCPGKYAHQRGDTT